MLRSWRKKPNTILCLHHTDLDGAMSGAIVGYWAEKHNYNIEYRLYNYGYTLEKKDLEGYKYVFAVDISFHEDCPWVYEFLGDRMVWIDHHKTAIDYQDKHGLGNIKGKRGIGRGACELTWEFLFPNTVTPKLVQYLSAYDIWDKGRFDWKTVEQIQWGSREEFGVSAVELAKYLKLRALGFSDCFTDIRLKGETILSYVEKNLETKIKHNGFYIPELIVDGVGKYRALMLNTNEFTSKAFESIYNPDKFDIMIPFAIVPDDETPGKVYARVSFYTENPNVDVSEIAKIFGGGGHKGAAGCTMSIENIQEMLKGSVNVNEYLKFMNQ